MCVLMEEELESSLPQGLRLVEVYEAMLHSFQMACMSCGSSTPHCSPAHDFPLVPKAM